MTKMATRYDIRNHVAVTIKATVPSSSDDPDYTACGKRNPHNPLNITQPRQIQRERIKKVQKLSRGCHQAKGKRRCIFMGHIRPIALYLFPLSEFSLIPISLLPFHGDTPKRSRLGLKARLVCSTEGECCFVQDMTEVSGKTLHCNKNSASVREQDKAANNTLSSSLFVNYAAIAWEDSRRRWIGERHQSSQRIRKDPVISWSLAYEDLLASSDPFPQPIPLPEMVDFLVDIWHDDEGLVE